MRSLNNRWKGNPKYQFRTLEELVRYIAQLVEDDDEELLKICDKLAEEELKI